MKSNMIFSSQHRESYHWKERGILKSVNTSSPQCQVSLELSEAFTLDQARRQLHPLMSTKPWTIWENKTWRWACVSTFSTVSFVWNNPFAILLKKFISAIILTIQGIITFWWNWQGSQGTKWCRRVKSTTSHKKKFQRRHPNSGKRRLRQRAE